MKSLSTLVLKFTTAICTGFNFPYQFLPLHTLPSAPANDSSPSCIFIYEFAFSTSSTHSSGPCL
nr:hypothetical protein Iba_scaffold21539CG0240 [Ipomoea batatas]